MRESEQRQGDHRRLPDERARGQNDRASGPSISLQRRGRQPLLRPDQRATSRPGRETASSAQLAIILDGQVRSAPSLNRPSRSQRPDQRRLHAEGRSKTWCASSAPAPCRPRSSRSRSARTRMGATLGEDTINRAPGPSCVAFAAVLIFMLVYYRFAGLVACVALLANLLLTVAFMVLVQATFTLARPGRPGAHARHGGGRQRADLRALREERERGASLALAIRNGYDRAFPTIIDTHLSSIFTAIVLYVVGNDQLKGFGISLTVGLIISLFTSLYMTRTIFDIWLAKNWLHKLYVHAAVQAGRTSTSWRIRYYWFAATIVLTILGAALFIYRLDNGGLNIDFVGGTAYTGQLKSSRRTSDAADKLEAKLTPDDSRSSTPRPNRSASRSTATCRTCRSSRSSSATRQSSARRPRAASSPSAPRRKNAPQGAARSSTTSWATCSSASDEGPGRSRTSTARRRKRRWTFVKSTTRTPDQTAGLRLASPRCTRLLDARVRSRLGRAATSASTAEARARRRRAAYSKMRRQAGPSPIPARRRSRASLDKVQDGRSSSTPQPERLENFDSQLAADTQQTGLVRHPGELGRHPAVPVVPLRQLDLRGGRRCSA